jgi:hypothetical protein
MGEGSVRRGRCGTSALYSGSDHDDRYARVGDRQQQVAVDPVVELSDQNGEATRRGIGRPVEMHIIIKWRAPVRKPAHRWADVLRPLLQEAGKIR